MLVFFLLMFCSLALSDLSKCQALILAGGGDHGAFEAGVIDGIVALSNTTWNVLTGTSAGSLNVALVGQFRIGDETAAAAYTKSFWSSIDRHDIYKEWPGGLIEGLTLEPGLLDTSPAVKILAPKWLHGDKLRQSDRHIEFGATNIRTFEYTPFDPSKLNDSEVLDAILASSAIPGLFPPHKIGSLPDWYVDGLASQNTPIATAINKCRDLGYAESDLILDVILADHQVFGSTPEVILTPFVLVRAAGQLVTEIMNSDLAESQQDFPKATFRVFKPQGPLPGYFVGFEHAQMVQMMEMGYKEAQSVLGLRR